MGNEAWFDNVWWARRKGDRIWIGKSYERQSSLCEAVLVLLLTEDGGITLDPMWEKLRLTQIQHDRTWEAMLRRLMLPVTLESKLSDPPPLSLFSEEKGMLEYLRKLAQGELHSLKLEEQERELLTQALDYAFPGGAR